ncbi:MAG: hypothetical protein FJY37_13980 [Betaproteobacteria bacterium]|nr:hypothetical protein [Betaproteobacteria bacterium]
MAKPGRSSEETDLNLSIAQTTEATPSNVEFERDALLRAYRHMVMAREIDALEEHFAARGEAWFQVSGAGHEAVATLAAHLGPQDWLHCHYRDKALMLTRGMTAEMFFHALFCTDGSHSRGRQMSAHMSWRDGHVLSLCGPVGNNALQSVGIAMQCKEQADALSYCAPSAMALLSKARFWRLSVPPCVTPYRFCF